MNTNTITTSVSTDPTNTISTSSPAHSAVAVDRARTGRAKWPLLGVVAGVAGFVGGLAAIGSSTTKEDANIGVDVVDKLERGQYHVAFIAGIVTVIALLFASAGWRRWADERGIRKLGARVVGAGMAATAAVHLIGTASAGSLSIYMPGGSDEGWLSREALFVHYTVLDFGMLLAWWGVFVSALAVATLAFGRRRVLPRWMGVASIVLMLPPVAAGLATGLPGLPGLVMPIWLTVISIGMFASRTARA